MTGPCLLSAIRPSLRGGAAVRLHGGTKLLLVTQPVSQDEVNQCDRNILILHFQQAARMYRPLGKFNSFRSFTVAEEEVDVMKTPS